MDEENKKKIQEKLTKFPLMILQCGKDYRNVKSKYFGAFMIYRPLREYDLHHFI